MNDLYPPESQRTDFIGHLDELRRRILTCLLAFLLVCGILLSQGTAVLALLQKPARGFIKDFVFLTPTEAFAAYFQAVLLATLVAASPVVFYELWMFLAPALSVKSRSAVLGWFGFALVSFYVGIVFSYLVLLPSAVSFLVSFGEGIARPTISVGGYVSFAATLILLGGCVFEIPLVMGLLAEAGIAGAAQFRASRRYAILINLTIAAIVTPTQDVFNLILFAGPMLALYEVGVVLAGMVEKRKKTAFAKSS